MNYYQSLISQNQLVNFRRYKRTYNWKVGVLKNNKLEAVVISTQEYERLKELEELMNNIEHKRNLWNNSK